jgi:3-mercaptopyruvate sulfurtransferase SseA
MLRNKGIANVRALVGGYEAWVTRGDPVVKEDRSETRVLRGDASRQP